LPLQAPFGLPEAFRCSCARSDRRFVCRELRDSTFGSMCLDRPNCSPFSVGTGPADTVGARVTSSRSARPAWGGALRPHPSAPPRSRSDRQLTASKPMSTTRERVASEFELSGFSRSTPKRNGNWLLNTTSKHSNPDAISNGGSHCPASRRNGRTGAPRLADEAALNLHA
jgi:hypothetical protein